MSPMRRLFVAATIAAPAWPARPPGAQPTPAPGGPHAAGGCALNGPVAVTGLGAALGTTMGDLVVGSGQPGALTIAPGTAGHAPAITPRSGTLAINGRTIDNGSIIAGGRVLANQGFGVNGGRLPVSNATSSLWTVSLAESGRWSKPFPWSLMSTIVDDGVAAPGVGANGFFLFDNVDAPTARGGRAAIAAKIQVNNAPALNGDVAAGTFTTIISSPFGRGSAFATNPVVDVAGSLGRLAGGVSAEEIDVGIGAGTSVPRKIGLAVTELPGDASQGIRGDEAILLGNAAHAVGWKLGLAFGDFSSAFPVAADGTLIGVGPGTQGSLTAADGIDFASVRFFGDSLRLPGFAVAGTGHLLSSGRAPPARVCGAGPRVRGTDTAGVVAVGAGRVTSCAVRFATSYAAVPAVTLTPQGIVPVAVSVVPRTTGFTAYFASSLGGRAFAYQVVQP